MRAAGSDCGTYFLLLFLSLAFFRNIVFDMSSERSATGEVLFRRVDGHWEVRRALPLDDSEFGKV
jgi:hypothetical protein